MVLVKLGLRWSGHRKVNFKRIHYKLQPRIPKRQVWNRVRVRVHYEHIVQMVSTLNKRLFYYYFFFVSVQHNFMIFFQIYTAVDPRSLWRVLNDIVNRSKKMTVGELIQVSLYLSPCPSGHPPLKADSSRSPQIYFPYSFKWNLY